MKGDPKVIEMLNHVLTGELTAINQYFLHARMCKSWGYERIAQKVMKESIEEMKHAQDLTDRILFLEGVPNLQKILKLNVGETIPEQFKSDLGLEETAITLLRSAVKIANDASDYTSRELFEHILEEEEKHVDWLEAQLQIIKDVGIQNYLAEQIGS